jgi:hypothetical protein
MVQNSPFIFQSHIRCLFNHNQHRAPLLISLAKCRLWLAHSTSKWEKSPAIQWSASFYDGFLWRMSRPTTTLPSRQVRMIVFPYASTFQYLTWFIFRFDNSGAGACLRRYSDPSYFKKSWDVMRADKTANLQKESRSQKMKVLLLIFCSAILV